MQNRLGLNEHCYGGQKKIGPNPSTNKNKFSENASVSEEEARSMWRLKRAGLSFQDLRVIWDNSPASVSQKKFLPSKDEAIRFLSNFSSSNRTLYDLIGGCKLFDENFDEYNEVNLYGTENLEYFGKLLSTASFYKELSADGRRIVDELKSLNATVE